jgi:hypothetical protein
MAASAHKAADQGLNCIGAARVLKALAALGSRHHQ